MSVIASHTTPRGVRFRLIERHRKPYYAITVTNGVDIMIETAGNCREEAIACFERIIEVERFAAWRAKRANRPATLQPSPLRAAQQRGEL
jgi:hypothetical protein